MKSLMAMIVIAGATMLPTSQAIAHSGADHLDSFKARPKTMAKSSSSTGEKSCLSPGLFGQADNSQDPYRFRVVYVHTENTPDRSNEIAAYAEQATYIIKRKLAQSSSYQKALRFDTTASCGERRLDLGVVSLNFDRSGERKAMDSLRQQVRGYMAGLPEQNLMMLVDGVNRQDNYRGLGEMKAPGGRHGGRLSTIFLGDKLYGGDLADTMLHEAMHNLGAVRDDAPHSTLGGHLFEGYDIMQQGGGTYQGPMTYPCGLEGAMRPLDCGGDDYYNPSPETGSPMANADRNTYLAPFMASCAELGCNKEEMEGINIESISVARQRGGVTIRLSLGGPSLADNSPTATPDLASRKLKGKKNRSWRTARAASRQSECYESTCIIRLSRLKSGVRYRARIRVEGRAAQAESKWVYWRQR